MGCCAEKNRGENLKLITYMREISMKQFYNPAD